MRPRCGHPMLNYETRLGVPILDDPVCGRREGHRGQHRSKAALAAARERRAADQAPSGSAVLAAAIREARAAAGLSQRSLAAAVGVTETAVQHWEHAKRTPGDESWTQLQLALGPLGIVRSPEPEAQEAATGEADAA